MKNKYRVILDTNVIVVAYLYKLSNERKLFDCAHENHVLLFSGETFLELEDVLLRPKFDRYSSKKRRRSFIRYVRRVAHFVDVSTIVSDVRDPKDDKFLALAIDAGADYLITEDNDFLQDTSLLEKYKDIKIYSLDRAIEAL